MAKSLKTPSWNDLMLAVRETSDVKARVKAARALGKTATKENVGDLYSLLASDDYFIREAAAEPLARLEKEKVLKQLFDAWQRGQNDGHDNDGLTSTLIGLIESNRKAVAPILSDMLKSSDSGVRCDAIWAMGYIADQIDPSLFFDVARNDPDPEVRSEALEALMGYIGTKQKPPPDTTAFTGRWMWLDTPSALQYGFEIEGAQGICIRNNAPTYAVGDVMLKIELCSAEALIGTQIFMNGAWYPVAGRLERDKLYLQGGGVRWMMERN